MKTRLLNIALFALLFVNQIFAQDVTTVRASNADISDNLDLKAIASIFGDSRDLEDFERRLNDPNIQISNLDLNADNRVDYLRVVESTENNTHLIVVQAVLGVDVFQDVATLEVERDRSNNVVVQVVGDTYMYGPNYIYEPVYVTRPVIYDVFWASSYRPYYSPWYWNYYPTYYTYWSPYPVYRYRNHIHHNVINVHNTYNYVNVRRSSRAAALYSTRRMNAYERQNPNRSFTSRTNAQNRYALEQTRSVNRANSTRGTYQPARNSALTPTRGNTGTGARSYEAPTRLNNTTTTTGVRQYQGTRDVSNSSPVRSNTNYTRDNNVLQPSAPTRTQQAAPQRAYTPSSAVRTTSSPAPVRSNNATVPTRSYSAPAVRNNPAPAMRSNPAPAMRSNPAPQRQMAPAAGNGGRNNSRG